MNTPCDIPWPHGLKKTKQRVQVLEALAALPAPVTAQDLAALLERQGTPVWLSTIYRILDTFTEQDMVVKTPIIDSGMSIYELNRSDHRHYAVCVLCHRVIAMENCPMDSFLPQLSEQDFHVLGHRLQMYGYCGSCAKAKHL